MIRYIFNTFRRLSVWSIIYGYSDYLLNQTYSLICSESSFETVPHASPPKELSLSRRRPVLFSFFWRSLNLRWRCYEILSNALLCVWVISHQRLLIFVANSISFPNNGHEHSVVCFYFYSVNSVEERTKSSTTFSTWIF